MLVTIIIPCFNEKESVKALLEKVLEQKYFDKQIILVDDCSNDGTTDLIRDELEKMVDQVIYQKNNKGKGAAIREALPFVKGEIVIIQDADLEYEPSDYKTLTDPIINQNKKVVYGSRVLGKSRYFSAGFFAWYRAFFNHILTIITNILYKQNITDAHTCYKIFDSSIIPKLNLIEDDFAFCPEFTAQVSKLNIKIHEVPITYRGRVYTEGKKITVRDGLRAVQVLWKNYKK